MVQQREKYDTVTWRNSNINNNWRSGATESEKKEEEEEEEEERERQAADKIIREKNNNNDGSLELRMDNSKVLQT